MAAKELTIPAPKTQTLDAVKALLQYTYGHEPGEALPDKVELPGGLALVLSSKHDCYYSTTATSCSCPAGAHHKLCRHRREAFQVETEAQKHQRKVREQIAASHAASSPVLADGEDEPFKPCLE